MSIEKILNTSVICPVSEHESLLELLQLWGKIEISGQRRKEEYSQMPLDETVDDLNYIVSFLNKYSDKESAYKNLKEGIKELSYEELMGIADSVDILEDYTGLREMDGKIKEAKTGISDRRRQIESLRIIKDVEFSAEDISFSKTGAVLARMDEDIFQKIKKEPYIYSEIVARADKHVVLMLYLTKDEKKVKEFIAKAEAEVLSLPDNETPKKVIQRLKKEIDEREKEISRTVKKIKKDYMDKKFNYMVLLDVYENENELINESQKTEHTKYMSVIRGWVPAAARSELEELVMENFKASYVHFSKPKKDDKPPVILKNNNLSEPFEVVTNLYGTPAYSWLDPTAYLAPFFILFFGLCLTDAGYGIIIAAATLWALKNFNLKAGARKFIKMMMWGGVASIVAGALTGSWFGNAVAGVAPFEFLKIYDPLERPELFLYFSVFLGYIQVLFGLVLSAIQKFNTDDVKGSIFEDLPWIVILLAVPLYFAGGIFSYLGKYLAFGGLAAVVFLSGHQSKSLPGKFFSGLYNLYGGTDYVKDMISYSRLFALGMGTGILAMAINEITRFTVDGFGWLGYIAAPFILLIGHLVINLMMSSLSAYVHTSRLQYVEFFTKFFKGGGKAFSPFSWKKKRVDIKW